MIITPKNAIELVLARKTSDFRFRPYETAVQKWLFLSAAIAALLSVAAASTAPLWTGQIGVAGALVLLLLSVILVAAHQVAIMLPEFRKLRNVEKEISNPLLTEFNDDMDLIGELATSCELHHLSFAKASYLRMARQLRERIAILVGAIDKVGVIPLAITGYLSYSKARKEALLSFGGIEWVSVAFIFLYLFAIRMSSTAQWMEKIAELYEHAIAVRSRSERQ
jgi:hypothetical protein